MKVDRAQMFNILRGIVMASALPSREKRALCRFITELEEEKTAAGLKEENAK